MIFLILSEENMFRNHVVTEERGMTPVWYLPNGFKC